MSFYYLVKRYFINEVRYWIIIFGFGEAEVVL